MCKKKKKKNILPVGLFVQLLLLSLTQPFQSQNNMSTLNNNENSMSKVRKVMQQQQLMSLIEKSDLWPK